MASFDKIETNRLILREFTEIDVQGVHQYASDPDVSKYVPWGPNTLKQTEEFVRIWIEYQNKKDRVDFELALIEKTSNKLIGAGRIHISDKENREDWIGYAINRLYWKKDTEQKLQENY